MNRPEDIEDFYQAILGITAPWEVVKVDRKNMPREVIIHIEYSGEETVCPECGKQAKRYDTRIRRLRHLDTCNYKTILEVQVPRVNCGEHHVQQLPLDFAEKSSRFTVLFESLVLMLLQDEPISSVAENLNLTWDEVDGIMQRAINRGLARREKTWVKNLGIDETSYQKRHKYVTVLVDKDRGIVLDVLPDRKAETVTEWLRTQKACNIRHIQSISMDMWDPFIKAVREAIPHADRIIAFDRFHVCEHLNWALDKVRAREHKALAAEIGSSPLTKTRFLWLTNSERVDNRTKKRKGFLDLTRLHLQTSRAWRIKETASTIWDLRYMAVVIHNWKRLLGWISRCRIPEMIQVGKTIKHYFWGIINAIRLQANNSMLESKNACIQRIKKIAFGFRNKERFRRSILFHLGGLDMSPSTL